VPRVVDGPNFHVYVYAEASSPHKLAHCQVRWTDGTDVQVTLPGLRLIAGQRELSRAEKEFIAGHLDDLVAKWQELNPER
jgi:hypothetical protein